MGILVHEDFEFIIQGITGREAVNFTRECFAIRLQDRRRGDAGERRA